MSVSDYGARFLPKESLAGIVSDFQPGRKVRVAGRLMSRRDMGKSTFADIKDEGGRIQTYAKRRARDESYAAFKSLSLGDIIGLEGELFSRTGEKTIKIEKYERLSRSSAHSRRNGTA